ncbi:hypothetical protein KPL78_21370 [Roseomonas sp. HJA6]|uniref:DUF6950 domain-containing protein n=1 Tax=Roseomonas alba TaxID=2846776 RepID=A0ABS7AED9_9PROT|nr:hypothetical protein [Neoroseomonas alba]MBW6400425.1 hypothetical protein [Neoroseomonas alba]
MARLPDWPARLAALLVAAETRPFDAHRWNCGRFALASVEACTGAPARIRMRPSLEATADSAGFPRVPPAFARPGDVVLAGDPPRLGVAVAGGRAAFVGPHGLVRVPLTTCTTAWRID